MSDANAAAALRVPTSSRRRRMNEMEFCREASHWTAKSAKSTVLERHDRAQWPGIRVALGYRNTMPMPFCAKCKCMAANSTLF